MTLTTACCSWTSTIPSFSKSHLQDKIWGKMCLSRASTIHIIWMLRGSIRTTDSLMPRLWHSLMPRTSRIKSPKETNLFRKWKSNMIMLRMKFKAYRDQSGIWGVSATTTEAPLRMTTIQLHRRRGNMVERSRTWLTLASKTSRTQLLTKTW